MAYVKQEWKNLPNQTTPANATRMNHIEDGIYNNSVEISNTIESGSNSNGNWIKYSDGTLIQYGKVTKPIDIKNKSSASNWYYDDGYIINFPLAFFDANYFADVICATGSLITLNIYSITTFETSYCKFNLSSNVEYSNSNYFFRWFAIGRWK